MRFRTKSVVVCVAATICILLDGCFKEPLSPIVPTWDVDVTVPLLNRSYSLADLVAKDSSVLHVGAGNQLIYSTTVQSDRTYLGDLIEIDPVSTSAQLRIGRFTVDAVPVVVPVDIPLLQQGTTSQIPDTTVSLADVQGTIGAFNRIVVSGGSVSLALRNNLPVAIDLTGPLSMLDAQNNVITTFTFNPATIQPNTTRSSTADLTGKTLTQDIAIGGLQIHIHGSATPVAIPNGPLLVGTLTTSNLEASQAVVAQIPQQLLDDRDTTYVSLADSTIFQQVFFHQGAIDIAFQNSIDMNVTLKFRLEELLRKVGSTWEAFEDSVYLPAKGSGFRSIDLAGFKIQSTSGGFISDLTTIISLHLAGTGSQYITLNDTDGIAMSVSGAQPYIADSAVCVLKPTWIDVNEVVRLDLGDLRSTFNGSFQIPTANLTFFPQVDLGFPLDMEVVFAARKNAAGEYAYLQIPATQKRLSASTTSLEFDPAEVGQFLSQLSGNLPDSLEIIGSILVNPPGAYDPTPAGVHTVGRNSSFGGSVALDVPLQIGIVGGHLNDTLAVGDSTGDGNKDFDLNKGPISDVNTGKLSIEVVNALPLQVGIRLNLLGKTRQNLLMIPQSGSPLLFAAPPVDGQGNVTVPANSTSVIELNQSEVQQFNPAEFMVYDIALDTTPGVQTVRFSSTDNIRIRVWSTLSYRVNP